MSKYPQPDESKLFGGAKENGAAKENGQTLEQPDSKVIEPATTGNDPQELGRIQNALAFLSDVRGDFSPAHQLQHESIDTVSFAQQQTLNHVGTSATEDVAKPPQVIERYLITKLLGEGGFAKVFLAHDPKLNRPVALKVLKPSSFFSSEVSARFEREARAAAVLNHPNIVPVFESGSAGTTQYIVSAYFEAESLDRWFRARDREVDCETAAKIVATLADATEHAHQRGVLHRDLKPANVLIQSDADGNNELRITDFGLAKHLGSTDQLRTTEGAVVGTPAYMSPEQAQGSSGINGATDIYSLGVMLYELLTGELPILGATHIDTLLAIRTQEPKPMPRKLPVDLRAICMKCLNKRTEARYLSAYELAEDLRRWLNGKPVKARRVSQVERLKKWCVRNPALTIALIGMTAGLAFSLVQWQRADVHWRNSQAETVRARDEAKRAQRSIQLNQLTIKELVWDISNSSEIPAELRYVLIGRASSTQTKLLAEDPENEDLILQLCEINYQYVDALVKVGKYSEANTVCEESLEIVQPLMTGESPPVSIRNRLRGFQSLCLMELGETERAVDLLQANLEESDGDLQSANDHRLTALVFAKAGDENSAFVEFQISRLVFESLDQDNMFVSAESVLLFRDFARFEVARANFQEAELLLQTALERQTAIAQTIDHGTSIGRLSQIKAELAEAKTQLGKLDEAKDLLNGALDRFKSLHEEDPKNARFQDSLFRTHLSVINLAVAKKDFSKAAEGLAAFDLAYRDIVNRLPTHEGWGNTLASLHVHITQHFEQRELSGLDQLLADAHALLDFLQLEYPDNECWDGYRDSLEQIDN